MRCPHCRSYIPEGIDIGETCPECIRKLESSPTLTSTLPSPPKKQSSASSSDPISTEAFAPFFTIRTRLSFGLADQDLSPEYGSISFGPNGLGIVLDSGKRWEKIFYRDLSAPQLDGSKVCLTIRDVESNLAFFHSGSVLSFLFRNAPIRKRAFDFISLVHEVKSGLGAERISYYQNRFKA